MYSGAFKLEHASDEESEPRDVLYEVHIYSSAFKLEHASDEESEQRDERQRHQHLRRVKSTANVNFI